MAITDLKALQKSANATKADAPESTTQMSEQLAAALSISQPAVAPPVSADDPDANEAFAAVMQALAAPAAPVPDLPRAVETEVRPQVKQAAAAPSAQPMREAVGAATKTVNTEVGTATAHFISRYHSLTLYVDVGFREQHQGVGIVRNVPIRFKEGRYLTNDKAVAAALRKHPRFNMMFQETNSAQLSAFVAGAAKAREMLRNNVTAGPASSNDSNDFAQMSKDAELAGIEQKLFQL